MNIEQFFIKLEALIVLVKPYTVRLWEKRKEFILINAASLVLVLIWLIVLYTPSYEAELVIFPEYGGTTAGGSISQLTSLLGVSGGSGASMEIYERLVKTPTIIEPVIYSKYYSYKLEDSVDLITLFSIEPNSSLMPHQQGRGIVIEMMKTMDELVSTSLDIQTKILTVKVIMPEGQLAADVANSIVTSLNNYLNTRRRTKASNQMFYLEKRLNQLKDSLTIAEETLKTFRINNRVIAQSPGLILDQNRLIRNVDILQAVYIELTKQLELTRLEAIRETPVLNVREPAADPIEKLNPKRRLKFSMAMFFSLVASLMYCVFFQEIKDIYQRIKHIYVRV